MERVMFRTIGTCMYIREEMHKPFVFIAKLPAVITALIPMKRKMIVKLADGQIRYLDKKNLKIIPPAR
jgi:hypothetical protein